MWKELATTGNHQRGDTKEAERRKVSSAFSVLPSPTDFSAGGTTAVSQYRLYKTSSGTFLLVGNLRRTPVPEGPGAELLPCTPRAFELLITCRGLGLGLGEAGRWEGGGNKTVLFSRTSGSSEVSQREKFTNGKTGSARDG